MTPATKCSWASVSAGRGFNQLQIKDSIFSVELGVRRYRGPTVQCSVILYEGPSPGPLRTRAARQGVSGGRAKLPLCPRPLPAPASPPQVLSVGCSWDSSLWCTKFGGRCCKVSPEVKEEIELLIVTALQAVGLYTRPFPSPRGSTCWVFGK